ncbi:hypothetical protein GCM10011309_03750 [Litorimonas cladophorae]|uniref:DUF1697 domain-containing protein n=1 Tax=Litorimonas cladophorae TaxID=1220491 RepID=A0A918KCY0_9PROT|nr:DUF1697 domain-containing protein [Litorimonas cladophorae]GGX57901.1 hypothetical protein GCM10011309_03750 [Litorimonas cladophorae]
MKTWIILLRGINVGGNRVLKMADLRGLLGGLGCQNVKTYIQSGNCVLDSEIADAGELKAMIATAIKLQFDYDVPTFAMTSADMETAIAANPYDVDDAAAKNVHLFFLSAPAVDADVQRIEDLCHESEAYTLSDSVFYLHAPNGIWKSKLAAGVEKTLGVHTTARNLRSANKIMALAIRD